MTMPAAAPSPAAPSPVVPSPVSGAPQQVVVPRWGYQTSFFQRRQPAFWLFVVLLAITTVVVLGRQIEFINARPTAWFFSIVLLLLYVAPLAIAIYVLDLFEREPISLLVAAFLWGGVVAIGLAGMTNTAWLQILQKTVGPEFARDWGPALIGPSIEETLKGLGIVVLFLVARAEFDDVFDGFVYGAVIGLGFAAVEDLDYFVRLSAANDQIGSVVFIYFIRVISAGLYGHVLYTGLVGMGFAYFVTRRDQPYQRRLQVGVGAVALAWLAHFIWNSPIFSFLLGDGGVVNWFITATVKGLPMLAAFAFLVYLAQKREARWFAYVVARDVGTDVLTSDEVTQLSDLRTRRRARKAVLARKGPVAEKLMGRLQHEQINLAMVHTRVSSEEDQDLIRQRALIRALRAELMAIPDLPPGVVAPAAIPQPGQYAQSTPPAAGQYPPGRSPSATASPWAPTPSQTPPVQPTSTPWPPTASQTPPVQPAPTPAPAATAWADPTASSTAPTPTPAATPSTPSAQAASAATPASAAPAGATMGAAPGPTGVSPAPLAGPRSTSLFAPDVAAGPSESVRMPQASATVTTATTGTPPTATPTSVRPTASGTSGASSSPSAGTLPPWSPTHLVPIGGMQAWATPDPSRAPIAMLSERLDVRVIETAADWAHVVATNGWSGWVDGRRLIRIGG